MELSHAISDAVLTLVGVFVFFQYLRKLELATCLLWEAFILSVTVAAFFGIIRFLGYSQAIVISEFFQRLAGTVGAFCLVLVSFLSVMRKPVEKNTAFLSIFNFSGNGNEIIPSSKLPGMYRFKLAFKSIVLDIKSNACAA